VDAFVDDERLMATVLLRTALFFEAFAGAGDAFLAALHRPEHPSISPCAALNRYIKALDRVDSRAGLIGRSRSALPADA
jgi:hypothetical protein